MKDQRRNVLLDGELRPLARLSARRDPEGNDRIFAIERRNCGRMRRGTATIWRWLWIIEAIKF